LSRLPCGLGCRGGIRLGIDCVYRQSLLRPIHYWIYAAYQSITMQNRHNVVTVLTFVFGHVDLYAKLESEQLFCSLSIGD
jgi:hypothetical protein